MQARAAPPSWRCARRARPWRVGWLMRPNRRPACLAAEGRGACRRGRLWAAVMQRRATRMRACMRRGREPGRVWRLFASTAGCRSTCLSRRACVKQTASASDCTDAPTSARLTRGPRAGPAGDRRQDARRAGLAAGAGLAAARGGAALAPRAGRQQRQRRRRRRAARRRARGRRGRGGRRRRRAGRRRGGEGRRRRQRARAEQRGGLGRQSDRQRRRCARAPAGVRAAPPGGGQAACRGTVRRPRARESSALCASVHCRQLHLEHIAPARAGDEGDGEEGGVEGGPRVRHECAVCGITTTSAAHLEARRAARCPAPPSPPLTYQRACTTSREPAALGLPG